MTVTYEERKALLTDLVLRLRQQKTPEGSVTPIYQIVDSPGGDLSRDDHPYVEVTGSSVRLRVHPLITRWRVRWDDPGQRADGFALWSDQSYEGPRRLNRVVTDEKTKDVAKSIHTSVVKYLTSVRENNKRKDQQRKAAREGRRVARERVEALAATLKAAGFDARAFLDDPGPYLVVYFMKDVHVMLEPSGTRFGMGFLGKTRTLEVPEAVPASVEYMTLVRDFLVGVAALKARS